jgi:hypothetical protein
VLFGRCRIRQLTLRSRGQTRVALTLLVLLTPSLVMFCGKSQGYRTHSAMQCNVQTSPMPLTDWKQVDW